MPTPIGHSISGLALFWAITRRTSFDWKLISVAIFAAVLPDGDFSYGFFAGNPNTYHHQFTHSLVFVIAAGFVLALLFKVRSPRNYFFHAGLFSSMGMLHLLLDAACVDTSTPYGIQLLWPFSTQYFIFPVTPFLDVHRASVSSQFFSSMLNWHNVKTVTLEVAIFLPMVVVLFLWRRRTEEKQC